ncbi:MAG: branched-chain amino acid ABC transporter permease [Anaerolineaceae bacterium]|jgi:branched-chain amino acid transport system permease protein|nr:branched-chain amino acid ABC transporter permease [Anaerolineaceae bacterium]
MAGYYEGLFILVGINIIAVLGVSILTGFTRLFSFGNAGFMAIGAYTGAILSKELNTPLVISIIGGMIMAGFIAFLLGKITLGLKGDYFLIATLGFGESIRVIIENMQSVTGGARGYSGIPMKTNIWVVIISVVIAVWIAWNLLHSKIGRNFQAIREQEMAADAIGIDSAKYKNYAFVISAMFAAWAGVLFAHYFSFIVPIMFNLVKSSEMTITVVIGGLGSLTGSIIATTILTLLPELARAAAEYRMLAYGVAVVLIVTLRPSGLMGYREFSFKKTVAWIKNVFNRKKTSSPEEEENA